jgi:uncharacterized protein YukE
VSARQVQVDAGALQSAATSFAATAGQLDGPATTTDSGPAWQPSSTAVADVTDGTDHVTAQCIKRLTDYADKLMSAAESYTDTDTSAAGRLATTVQPD